MTTIEHYLISSIIKYYLNAHFISSDLYKKLRFYFNEYFKKHKTIKKSNLFLV